MRILHRIPTRLLTRVSGFICPTEGGCGQIIRLFPIFLIRIQAIGYTLKMETQSLPFMSIKQSNGSKLNNKHSA